MDQQNSQQRPPPVLASSQGNRIQQSNFKPQIGGSSNRQIFAQGQPTNNGGCLIGREQNQQTGETQQQFLYQRTNTNLPNQVFDIQIQNEQKNQGLIDAKIELNDLNSQIDKLQKQLEETKTRNKNLEEERKSEKIQKETQLFQLIQSIKKSKEEKIKIQQSIEQKQKEYHFQEQLIESNNQNNEINERELKISKQKIDKLEKENQTLEQQLNSISLQEKDKELQDQFESVEKQLQSLDQQISQSQEELKEQENKKKVIKQNIFFRDQTVQMLRDQKKKIEKKIKESQESIEQQNLEIDRQKYSLNGKNQIIEQYESLYKQSQLDFPNDYQDLQSNDRRITQQIKDNSLDSKKKEKTNSKILLNQRKQDQARLQEISKQTRAKQLKELQLKFKESHGLIEICFLIDCTGSMDPYKKQAELCVEKSMISVKQQTQRDSLWSLICYQDKAELRQLGAYKQLQFTDQTQQVTDFLQQVKCSGGGDAPEDLDGAIKQMIKNLKWKTQFRIAMLICDAPCHGTKFHNFSRNQDEYPDDDLTSAVELMIQNDIFFIGIVFTSHTIKMLEEIKQIYQRNAKSEYFYYYDLRNAQADQIFVQLVNVLTAVSQTATQTNVRSTKVQTQGKVEIEGPAGKKENVNPIEALCQQLKLQKPKQEDFVKETYRVFRIEFSDQTFNKKYLEIQNVDVNDFKQIEEGQWSCLRSKAPFAQGAIKSAYLMIKQHQNTAKLQEMYVCKCPKEKTSYRSIESAIKECLVHLIAQKWMIKFNRDLEAALKEKGITKRYPQIIYSDLLVFLDAAGNYWIGERFFEGEFVKYNNNFGFICQDKNDLNKLANSFSLYTFNLSEFKYLICDIQGVNSCFTDPAICTMNNCKIDDTDTGREGIARFNISVNKIKDSCQEILSILDLNFEIPNNIL